MDAEEAFNKMLDICDEIECPGCAIFCRRWVLAGREVYNMLNNKPYDKKKIDMVRPLIIEDEELVVEV